MGQQLGVLVQVVVTPGKLDELKGHFKEFYHRLGKEDGLEFRKLMIDQDDPSKLFVFELWHSREDFDKHLTSEHSRQFAEDIQGSYEPDGFIRTLMPFI